MPEISKFYGIIIKMFFGDYGGIVKPYELDFDSTVLYNISKKIN
jgi:hypothetical protein